VRTRQVVYVDGVAEQSGAAGKGGVVEGTVEEATDATRATLVPTLTEST